MIAKIWKKLLLAVCIIACLYNVMNKVVSRTSLEDQLKRVEGGNSIIDVNSNQVNTNSVNNETQKQNKTTYNNTSYDEDVANKNNDNIYVVIK